MYILVCAVNNYCQIKILREETNEFYPKLPQELIKIDDYVKINNFLRIINLR